MALYRDQFGYVDLPDPNAVVGDSEPATASMTLRLPSRMKSHVERAAAHEGVSPDSWLLMAIASSLGVSKPTPA
jgi:hypothetical protein